jgi:hypothetical protein
MPSSGAFIVVVPGGRAEVRRDWTAPREHRSACRKTSHISRRRYIFRQHRASFGRYSRAVCGKADDVARLITQYNRDYYGGALMLLIGLAAAIQGSRYPVGTLSHMGPGFFPTALGVILACLGIAIAFGARRTPKDAPEEKPLAPEWRGWACIIASVVAFIVVAKWGGFVPATFAITFISAMGDRDNTVREAALLAVAMAAVCVAVFWWALKMPFPLFGWGGA